ICLAALGQSINVMTLGGFALAVGILVDDATVTIESIHRNLAMGKSLMQAILDGADEIAVPAFVSTLAICVVFTPVFFLGDVTGALFQPLAMAVIFAMIASYILSRTLVPLMVRYLLPTEVSMYAAHHGGAAVSDIFWRVNRWFETHFDRLREWYAQVLSTALGHRRRVATGAAGAVLASLVMLPFVGQDFFPRVDGGQFRIHVRAPSGTRLEETEAVIAQIEHAIHQDVPPSDLGLVLANVGVPASSINLATGDNATIGPADAELLVSLNDDRSRSTPETIEMLRRDFRQRFPGVTFAFQPADIVNRILNLGLPAAIDVQVVPGRNVDGFKVAASIADSMRRVAGAVDVRQQQVINAPELFFAVDRTRASQLGRLSVTLLRVCSSRSARAARRHRTSS
ncbi:MAG TPA: efflux RND transporter permease subunit, partial [Gemmatimonadaceae bacterium]